MPVGVPKSGRRRPRVARIEIICTVCGSSAHYTASQLKKRTGLYCSHRCGNKQHSRPINKVECQCDGCGAEMLRFPSEITGGAMFCSKDCRWAAQKSTFNHSEWRMRNREAQLAREREWVKANPEAVRARKKKWADNNREYIRLAAQRRRLIKAGKNAASLEEMASIIASANGKCFYCDENADPLELDHFIPVARGGGGEIGNLIPACRSCNAKKGARDPHVWVREVWPSTEVFQIKAAILAAQGVHVLLTGAAAKAKRKTRPSKPGKQPLTDRQLRDLIVGEDAD